jgi:hypothetical protein
MGQLLAEVATLAIKKGMTEEILREPAQILREPAQERAPPLQTERS